MPETWGNGGGRRYEMMVAAGSDGYTLLPGEGSYSAHLIEALDEVKKAGKPVTTWVLAQMIMRKQSWRGGSNMHPILFGRDGRHIVLSPRVREEELLEAEDCMRVGAYLYR